MSIDLGTPYGGLTTAFFNALHKKAAVEEHRAMTFRAVGSTTEGVIVGIGASAGSPDKLDREGEFLDMPALKKMAYDFCAATSRTFKANHEEEIDCALVASWPGAPLIADGGGVRRLQKNEPLDPSMTVVGIDIQKGAESHWFVAVKPRDPQIAQLAAEGGIAGFSFGAYCTVTEE